MADTEQHRFSSGILLIGVSGNTPLVPTVALTVSATGGTFTLSLGSQVTAPITVAGLTAAAIQSALQAISNGFGATVTGTGPYVVQLSIPQFPLGVNAAAATGGTVTVGTWSLPKVGTVQDGGLDITYQAVDVETSAQESLFAIDRAYHGGKAESDITVLDFNRIVYEQMMNPIKTTAGAIDTYTFGATTSPIPFRAEFYGLDTKLKFMSWIMTRAMLDTGVSDGYSIKGFATRKFKICGIADPNATGATGYGISVVTSMQQ